MESRILCKKLNKRMSDIKFKVKKEDETQQIIYADVNENNKHLFSLRIYIINNSLVRTYFDLGKIIYTNKALFLVNKFNAMCPGDFVSYISVDENSMFRGGYLHVLVNIRDNDEIKVAELIESATNKLFSPSMEKYVCPLINLLIDSSIPNLSVMN